MNYPSLEPYPPFIVYAYSEPYARIVRHAKSGHTHMKATFSGMSKGQTIRIIHVDLKRDLSRIKASAANAEVRIKIEPHPAMYMILATSLGPHRKGRKTYSAPNVPRVPFFRGWKMKPDRPETNETIDIFS